MPSAAHWAANIVHFALAAATLANHGYSLFMHDAKATSQQYKKEKTKKTLNKKTQNILGFRKCKNTYKTYKLLVLYLAILKT